MIRRRSFIVWMIFLNILLHNFSVRAQEIYGFANSNFAGVMGLHLNPSSIVGAPYKYEFNFIAGDFFAENNYLYLRSFKDAGKKTNKYNDVVADDKKFFDDYNNDSKYGYVSTYIMGPSFIVSKRNSAFAFTTGYKNVLSANDIPSHFSKSFYSSLDYYQLHGITFNNVKMKAAALSYAWLGFTKAINFYNNDDHWWSWGFTVKGLIGFDGMYVDANIGSYAALDSFNMQFNHLDLEYAHAAANEKGDIGAKAFGLRGFGAAADLGITYIFNRRKVAYDCDRAADKQKKYDFKVGASLMEFGYIRFINDDKKFIIKDGNAIWYNIDTVKFYSFDQLDQTISNQFYNQPYKSRQEGSFGMFLPTAASLQIDYCLAPRWYANYTAVQRLSYSNNEVKRGNSMALSIRHERRKWEVTMPIMLYEYNALHLGIGLRYKWFVLGSDRLLSFVSDRINSFDLFFGFKWNTCRFNAGKYNTGECPY